MIQLFGISNCDTVKKSMEWLTKNKIDFTFFNYKKELITAEHINNWLVHKPLDKILNKKSTTWKSLTAEEQATVSNKTGAVKLMLKYNTLIKRPVLQTDDNVLVGFAENEWEVFLFNN